MIAVAIIASHPHTKAETLVKLTKHPHPLAPYWVIITGRLPMHGELLILESWGFGNGSVFNQRLVQKHPRELLLNSNFRVR